jgi:hypothetical protein
MPDQEERETTQRARRQLERGRAPTTAAGEFVRQEMHHIRRGKHGARSTKQAIAIALSKARRAGIPLRPGGRTAASRKSEQRDLTRGRHRGTARTGSRKRSRAVSGALRREPHRAASRSALRSQAKSTARRRGHTARVASARKAVRTKGPVERRQAARKGARTRARHRR